MSPSPRPPIPPKPEKFRIAAGSASQNTQAEEEPVITHIDPQDTLELSCSPEKDEQPPALATSPKQDSNHVREPVVENRAGVGSGLSVSDNVEKFVKTGILNTKNTAEALVQSTKKTLNIAETKIQGGFERSGAPQTFDEMGLVLKHAGRGVTKAVSNIQPPELFRLTSDDVRDLLRKARAKDDLCSKCRSLPIETCYRDAGTDPDESHWVTPLSRVIFHSEWCRMCQLLLSMLCRPEFDPLTHPEVAPHLQTKIRGMSMNDWVGRGWKFTDENWPFGRSETRHEGATYVLGEAGEILWDIAKKAPRLALALYTVVNHARGGSQMTDNRHPYTPTYAEGYQKGKQASIKYPSSCVFHITVMRKEHPQFPGLIFVNLVGYGNRPGGDAQSLSRFRLHVAHPAVENAVGSLSYGKLLDRHWIDMSTVRMWLTYCVENHGKQCNEHEWSIAMQRPGFLRVIDIDNLCLVEVSDPGSCRFVALSYVWGQVDTVMLKYSNIDEMKQRQGLRKFLEMLPRTVVDAMEVVSGLGEKYLWVDSLCILQENTREAREQIATMDRVYGSALLTIVAAQGNNAHCGISGVQRKRFVGRNSGLPREIMQPSAEIRNGAHIIAPFGCTQHLAGATWNSRAWTFQEQRLSKRLLIFCGEEVVWHCRKMICREDMPAEASGYGPNPLEWLSLKPEYFGIDVEPGWVDGSLETDRHGTTRLVRSGTFAQYARIVEDYTLRQLTYGSDIVRALQGLLHIFQLSFRSEFVCGLPKCLLDIALLWKPTQKLKRRKGFPSWSWAGWQGQVTYDKPMEVERDDRGSVKVAVKRYFGEEGVRPMLQWHILSESCTELERLNGHGRGVPLERGIPPEWEATPYFTPGQADHELLSRPLRLSDLRDPVRRHLPSSEIPHLIFYTSCVDSFHLGDTVLQSGDDERLNPAAPPSSNGRRPLRCSVVDSELQWIGTVLLDGEGPDWIDRAKHEFILLSEAQYFGLDKERYDVGEFPNYVVMLVERDNQTGVSTRLGLGRVKKTAWMMAKPVPRLVVLG